MWTFCDFWLEVLRVHLYWPGNSPVDSANYTGHGSLGGKQNTQWVPHALLIPAAIALDAPSVSVSAFYRDCGEVNITRVQLNLGESSSKHNDIGAHSCPSVGKIRKNFWSLISGLILPLSLLQLPPHFYQQLADVTCDVQCLNIMWYFIPHIFVVEIFF